MLNLHSCQLPKTRFKLVEAHFIIKILSHTIPKKEYRTQKLSMGLFTTKIIHDNDRNFQRLLMIGRSYQMEIYEISIFLSGRRKEYRIIPDIPNEYSASTELLVRPK